MEQHFVEVVVLGLVDVDLAQSGEILKTKGIETRWREANLQLYPSTVSESVQQVTGNTNNTKKSFSGRALYFILYSQGACGHPETHSKE